MIVSFLSFLFQCQINTGKTVSQIQDVEQTSQTRPGSSFCCLALSIEHANAF